MSAYYGVKKKHMTGTVRSNFKTPEEAFDWLKEHRALAIDSYDVVKITPLVPETVTVWKEAN